MQEIPGILPLIDKFILNMFNDRFEECLDALNQLGVAEIEASCKVKVAEASPYLLDYMRDLREYVNPGWFAKILQSIFGPRKWFPIEATLMIAGEISDLKYQFAELKKHSHRLQKITDIASLLVEELGYRWAGNAGSSLAFQVASERKTALMTHLAVLNQGIMATSILINNAETLVKAVKQAQTTLTLAKKINDNVREIYENHELVFYDETGNRTDEAIFNFGNAGKIIRQIGIN